MLIESDTFAADIDAALLRGSHVFRYCDFVGLIGLEERGMVDVDSTFISSTFEGADFYWTLFNSVVAISCTFTNCAFRGVTFASCKFVECTFVNCTFTLDNLGGECTFPETSWYACTQRQCAGLPASAVPEGTGRG